MDLNYRWEAESGQGWFEADGDELDSAVETVFTAWDKVLTPESYSSDLVEVRLVQGNGTVLAYTL